MTSVVELRRNESEVKSIRELVFLGALVAPHLISNFDSAIPSSVPLNPFTGASRSEGKLLSRIVREFVR